MKIYVNNNNNSRFGRKIVFLAVVALCRGTELSRTDRDGRQTAYCLKIRIKATGKRMVFFFLCVDRDKCQTFSPLDVLIM